MTYQNKNFYNARKHIYVAPEHQKKSRYRGVYWDVCIGAWIAVIYKGKRKYDLGYFADEEEAARVYDVAAKRLYGEKAFTNFNYLNIVKNACKKC